VTGPYMHEKSAGGSAASAATADASTASAVLTAAAAVERLSAVFVTAELWPRPWPRPRPRARALLRVYSGRSKAAAAVSVGGLGLKNTSSRGGVALCTAAAGTGGGARATMPPGAARRGLVPSRPPMSCRGERRPVAPRRRMDGRNVGARRAAFVPKCGDVGGPRRSHGCRGVRGGKEDMEVAWRWEGDGSRCRPALAPAAAILWHRGNSVDVMWTIRRCSTAESSGLRPKTHGVGAAAIRSTGSLWQQRRREQIPRGNTDNTEEKDPKGRPPERT